MQTGLSPEEQNRIVMGQTPITTGNPSVIVPDQQKDPRTFGQRVSDFFSDEENVSKFIMALTPMMSPWQQKSAAVQLAQANVLQANKDKRDAKQQNKTIEYLKAQGVDPAMLEQAKGNPDLLKALLAKTFEKPEKPSAFTEKLAYIMQANPDMSEADAVKMAMSSSGTTINMPSVGTIPPGYRATYDEQGRVSSMEPIPGGPIATEAATTEESAQRKYDAYKTGVANLSKAFGMANTGSLAGLAPALTSGDLTFEGMRDVMLPVLKDIFKGKGEGTFTDADARQLLNTMPTKRDDAESAAFKLRAVDQIIRAKLGIPLSDPSPMSSNVIPTKEWNPKTGKIEDIK